MEGCLLSLPSPSPLTEDELDALASGGLVVRDRQLPPDAVGVWREALAGWSRDGRMTRAALGARRIDHPGLRGDLTCWMEPSDLPELWGWFEAWRVGLSNGARVALDGFELQAACYPGGGARYVRHVDALRLDASRRFTVLLYLQARWERAHGGQLLAWTPAGLRRVAPVGGRVVVFRSDAVPHAVAASKAPRYALTAWMRGPSWPLP